MDIPEVTVELMEQYLGSNHHWCERVSSNIQPMLCIGEDSYKSMLKDLPLLKLGVPSLLSHLNGVLVLNCIHKILGPRVYTNFNMKTDGKFAEEFKERYEFTIDNSLSLMDLATKIQNELEEYFKERKLMAYRIYLSYNIETKADSVLIIFVSQPYCKYHKELAKRKTHDINTQTDIN